MGKKSNLRIVFGVPDYLSEHFEGLDLSDLFDTDETIDVVGVINDALEHNDKLVNIYIQPDGTTSVDIRPYEKEEKPHWIDNGNGYYLCSECGAETCVSYTYCPDCGTLMRG